MSSFSPSMLNNNTNEIPEKKDKWKLHPGLLEAVDHIKKRAIINYNSPGDFFSIHTVDIRFGFYRNRGYEILLRINKSCNIQCQYCFVSPSSIAIPFDVMTSFVDKLPLKHGKPVFFIIVISGGEPSLHNNFFDIINYLLDKGIDRIIIQTNGIRFFHDTFYSQLPRHPGIEFFISLPSVDREIYNSLTHSKVYTMAMKGISNITSSYPAKLNFVVNRLNYTNLLATIDYVREHFSGNRTKLLISNLGCLDTFSWDELLVSYDMLLPVFKRVMKKRPTPEFTISGGCSFPLCVYRRFGKKINKRVLYIADTKQTLYNSRKWQYYKNDQCRKCKYTRYCPGFFSRYVDCFGDSEIDPF